MTSNSCGQAAPYKSNLPNSKLERETGTAPAPWWWKPQTLLADPGKPPPTPHDAYAAAALDPHLSSKGVYVHWLYAQWLGYTGAPQFDSCSLVKTFQPRLDMSN